MPKARSAKSKGTYEWINASIDMPPIGNRPSRAGNNNTGAKGKLKCAGCRLSKIKCVYDYSNINAVCDNCVRRGIRCGVKLLGPKSLPDVGSIGSDVHNRDSEELKEHTRLFEKFQQIRPDDSAEEIVKLIELVENGTLKEQGGTFVVRGSDESEIDELEGEQAYNTTIILSSEFEDGYFNVPRFTLGIVSETRNECLIPKDYIPLTETTPAPWEQLAASNLANFRGPDYTFGFNSPYSEDMGIMK